MTLANLEIGEKAVVTKVKGNNPISKRLMEMGIVPGVSVRIIKSAPFGDPIEIKVLGYNLAMRRNEAEAIEISKTFNK
jgi:Fe2+ transport system protein FeoA